MKDTNFQPDKAGKVKRGSVSHSVRKAIINHQVTEHLAGCFARLQKSIDDLDTAKNAFQELSPNAKVRALPKLKYLAGEVERCSSEFDRALTLSLNNRIKIN